jgi:hypothetical protein
MREKSQVVLPLNLGIRIPKDDFVFKVVEICEELDYTELYKTYVRMRNGQLKPGYNIQIGVESALPPRKETATRRPKLRKLSLRRQRLKRLREKSPMQVTLRKSSRVPVLPSAITSPRP